MTVFEEHASRRVTKEEFKKIHTYCGVIIEVEDFPQARKPSYRVTVDFGGGIIKRSMVQAINYGPKDLIGLQIVAVVNLPPMRIAGFDSEILLLGVDDPNGELSLLTPSRPAQLGSEVY